MHNSALSSQLIQLLEYAFLAHQELLEQHHLGYLWILV